MQKTKIDIVVFVVIFIFVFSLMIFGCSSESSTSPEDMYQKCITVNKENPDACDQEFTIYK